MNHDDGAGAAVRNGVREPRDVPRQLQSGLYLRCDFVPQIDEPSAPERQFRARVVWLRPPLCTLLPEPGPEPVEKRIPATGPAEVTAGIGDKDRIGGEQQQAAAAEVAPGGAVEKIGETGGMHPGEFQQIRGEIEPPHVRRGRTHGSIQPFSSAWGGCGRRADRP